MPKIKNPDIDVSRFSYDPDTGSSHGWMGKGLDSHSVA